MFTKSRQLILMGQSSGREFVETPGWLYHYEPFGIDIFIHHTVAKTQGGDSYYLGYSWRASDVSTGMSLTNYRLYNSRKEVVESLHERLNSYSLREYNECVWNALANSPPHKPSWRIDSVRIGYARKLYYETT